MKPNSKGLASFSDTDFVVKYSSEHFAYRDTKVVDSTGAGKIFATHYVQFPGPRTPFQIYHRCAATYCGLAFAELTNIQSRQSDSTDE